MKEFDYKLDYKNIDFKKPENRKLYRIGRGEQGVLLVRPYTDINIEDRTLWRAKANLLFPTCDRQLQHSLPHIDSNDEHQTIIYYVTDSDGDTLLFEDDKKTIVKRISPKKGRFLFFDGDIWHASTNPVKSMKRIVININLSVL